MGRERERERKRERERNEGSKYESTSWKERAERFGNILAAYPDSGHQHSHLAKRDRMDPAVRAAATEGNVDGLLHALEEHSSRDLLPLSFILDQRTALGDTLLHVAACSKSDGPMRLVIDHFPAGLMVAKNHAGDTALHVAARFGNLGCLGLLFRRTRQHNCGVGDEGYWMLRMKNHGDNTPLHEAVSSRNSEVIGLLLDEDHEPLFWQNKQGKSALYLAVETGDPRILDLFLGVAMDAEAYAAKVEGMSPVHAAVAGQHLGMLRAMSDMKQPLFQIKEAGGYTPLHLAVFTNYLEGTKFLLSEFSFFAEEHDDDGYLPIHLACKRSGILMIDQFLEYSEFPTDLLNKEGQSIVHVAAKYGRSRILMRLLRIPNLAEHVNHRDRDGDTALHLAAAYWQPLTLLVLTWDPRVDIKLRNYKCQTAYDIACIHRCIECYPPMRQWLAAKVLLVAGAQGSQDLIVRPSGHKRELNPAKIFLRPATLDRLQNKVGTQLIIATLIATVTFAAGFTLPGGVNGSESPDKGVAIMIHRGMFHAFVICNTIATYSSILVVIILLWTQATRDPSAVSTVYTLSVPPLKVALLALSGAFFTGVYPVLHKLPWLRDVVLVTGIAFIAAIISLSIVIHIRFAFQRRSIRWFTSVIFIGFIFVSASWRYSPVLEEEEEEEEGKNHCSKCEQKKSRHAEVKKNEGDIRPGDELPGNVQIQKNTSYRTRKEAAYSLV